MIVPKVPNIPVCHVDRKYYAKGLCRSCYRSQFPRHPNKQPSVCHPDRPHVSNGMCSACNQKEKYKNAPKRNQRDKNLRCFYKMTEAQFDEILKSQNGVCAVCSKGSGKRPFFVDHDHGCCPGARSCGKCVRGLVCQYCNTLLGFLESPNATKAQEYIKKFMKKQIQSSRSSSSESASTMEGWQSGNALGC